MEKRIKSHEEELAPSILYLDDLERIVEIFKEVSNEVEIFTSEYKLNSLDELKKLQVEKLDSLEIRIREPWILLGIYPGRTELYTDKDTPVSRGIIEKIKEILKARRRKLFWIAKEGIITIITTMFLGSFIILLVYAIEKKLYLLIPIGVLSLLLGIIFFWIALTRFDNEINIKRRKESKSFWKRKKDEIILSIISAIIGEVAPILTGHS